MKDNISNKDLLDGINEMIVLVKQSPIALWKMIEKSVMFGPESKLGKDGSIHKTVRIPAEWVEAAERIKKAAPTGWFRNDSDLWRTLLHVGLNATSFVVVDKAEAKEKTDAMRAKMYIDAIEAINQKRMCDDTLKRGKQIVKDLRESDMEDKNEMIGKVSDLSQKAEDLLRGI